jgi:ABC-2 type transport system permease protein
VSPTITIAVHELVVTARRRIFQVVTVALPLIAFVVIAIIGAVQGDDSEPGEVRAGYIDLTGLFTEFRLQEPVQFIPFDDPELAIEALLNEGVDRLFIIPPDYMATGIVQRYEVSQGIDIDEPNSDPALRNFLLDNLTAGELETATIARLKSPLSLANVRLDEQGAIREFDGGRLLFFMVLGVLLFISLTFSGGFLIQGLGEEKENRIMEVLLSSVTPGQLLVGKILGIGAAGLSQIVIWVVAALVIMQVASSLLPDVNLSVPNVGLIAVGLAAFLLGYLLFATILAGLGSITSSAKESQQLSIVVTLPALIPVYGMTFIISNPDAVAVRFLTFFPITAPIALMVRLGPGSLEPWEIVTSLGILTLSVVIMLLTVPKLFRAYLLMYGKRPGPRELWRTVIRS